MNIVFHKFYGSLGCRFYVYYKNQPTLAMAIASHLRKFDIGGQVIEIYEPDPVWIQQAWKEGRITAPYWSQVWPAAIALATYILQEPQLVKGKNVWELAGGLGLPSLVAARYAQKVVCTDLVPEALELVKQSARYLDLPNLETAVIDWRKLPRDLHPDLVLLSDVNYDPTAFNDLHQVIRQFLHTRSTILLSTPQRLVAKEFIRPLLSFCREQKNISILHSEREVMTTVLVLQK